MFYRHAGKVRRYTLGTYPTVTLKDAREGALAVLRDALRGNDPQEQKTVQREAGTFKEFAELYMEKHSIPNKKSWRDDRRMFDTYLLPKLKHIKAGYVTQDDCEKLLEDLAEDRPVQANRVRALLRHLYAWGLEKRTRRTQFVLTLNPCEYVPRLIEERARERVYADDELKILWKAFGEVGMVGDLFKLQLLTAARKGELVDMEWNEVDLNRAIWEQPGAITKNGKVHVVPLSPPAVRVLESLKHHQSELNNPSKRESDFVFFSSRTGSKPMAWLQKAADRVRIESKIEDFQAHDLRRTTATRLAQAGVPDNVLKMILNHSLGKDITGVYNQYKYFEERKKALAAWGSKLMVIVSDFKKVKAASGKSV